MFPPFRSLVLGNIAKAASGRNRARRNAGRRCANGAQPRAPRIAASISA
jgi:hypothetical protein